MLYKSLILAPLLIIMAAMLILPIFCFAQQDNQAITQSPKAPETFEEVKSFVFQVVIRLPEAIKQGWQKAKEIWQKTWSQWLNKITSRIKVFFGREYEKRKPIIKQELEKEKQEIKKEFPIVGKSLWERFKHLIE